MRLRRSGTIKTTQAHAVFVESLKDLNNRVLGNAILVSTLEAIPVQFGSSGTRQPSRSILSGYGGVVNGKDAGCPFVPHLTQMLLETRDHFAS